MNTELLEAIRSLASMPPDLVSAVVASLRRDMGSAGRASVEENVHHMPQQWRDKIRCAVALSSSSSPPVSPEALALAIEASALAWKAATHEQEVELVWSGPPIVQSTFRRTDRAWIDVIDGAHTTIWLASFSVGGVERIQEALLRALGRGVRIRMLFERTIDCGGGLRYDGFQQFEPSLLRTAEMYAWPLAKRERDASGNLALMHAKAVVADGHRMFVTSTTAL
jgi:cardiolipin synthase A/B